MNPYRARKRPSIRRCVAILIAAVAVIAGAYAAAAYLEREGRNQERGVAQTAIGQYRRVEYQGRTYVEKTGLTTILVMGVDKPSGGRSYGARQGGQADFLMLMVIDPRTERVNRLQIDRDTIAEVETLGVLGNVVGTKRMQICLAHGFGNNPEENCQHAVNAVENLLEGEEIDLYLALDMDSIGVVNHALGGVTVTLEDDFSASDPAMVPGATLQLTDEQAELFVRGRMSVGDGTNASRMARQRVYMSAAVEAFRKRVESKPEYIDEFLDAIENIATTNISRSRLVNEIGKAYRYETPDVETLAGEYRIGEDGFMEFHAADGAALDWIMRTLYAPQDGI